MEGQFQVQYNESAVIQRLGARIGALSAEKEALLQSLQESNAREMEAKAIIDDLMEKLKGYTEDNKEEQDGEAGS